LEMLGKYKFTQERNTTLATRALGRAWRAPPSPPVGVGAHRQQLLSTFEAVLEDASGRKNLQVIDSQGGFRTSQDVPERHEIFKWAGVN
jgi:hypothetical protein